VNLSTLMPRGKTAEEMNLINQGTRWPPGVSGNPAGRKVSAAVDKCLEKEGEADEWVDAMVKKIKEDRDVAAFKELTLRHEGHVPHEVTGNLQVTHVVLVHEDEDNQDADI